MGVARHWEQRRISAVGDLEDETAICQPAGVVVAQNDESTFSAVGAVGLSRRKESRRRHRDARRQRAPGELTREAAPTAVRERREISWLGLAGGLAGAALLGQAAAFNLVSSDGTLLTAVALAVLASVYLPAVWASVVATLHRRRVQRGVLAVTLVFVVVGVVFVDASFATLLLLPSTLLAIASGLIWQGRGGR